MRCVCVCVAFIRLHLCCGMRVCVCSVCVYSAVVCSVCVYSAVVCSAVSVVSVCVYSSVRVYTCVTTTSHDVLNCKMLGICNYRCPINFLCVCINIDSANVYLQS